MKSESEFLTILQPHKRLSIALLTLLIVFCAGVITVLSFVSKADSLDKKLKNQRASNYVSSLYREAEAASRALQPLSGQPCTDETIRRLRHIVAINPHIRSVNTYTGTREGCSSLEGSLPARKVTYAESHVPFYTVMRQEDGFIFYMVYFSSPGYLAGVAINGYFVREALRYISPDAAFYPLQDFMELSPQGYVWKNTRYPFVLVSSDTVNTSELLFKSREVIFFVLAASLLAGWLTYVSTGLINTPRFALKYYLHKSRFYPVYQPVISTRDNRVTGLEILMRCTSKTGKEIPPALFISMAEKNGMIRALTLQLLKKVEDDFSVFSDRGLYLAINITPDIIECTRTFSELLRFAERARKYNLDVLAEITERQSFTLTSLLSEKICRLREAGLRVAIDDFGTGYSNLSSITQISPDYLKIDKDFTGYSMTGGVREALLESVLHISATTAIPLIAEGVETPAQLQYMQDRGVWLFQGYLFCRPAVSRIISEYICKFNSSNSR
ncbi:EAL domain-containing protein [Erwiniaceae bacterium L1_55_4]|nr:EAL domain-containing protein [Erwiniaceae bacterium L1_55_4]